MLDNDATFGAADRDDTACARHLAVLDLTALQAASRCNARFITYAYEIKHWMLDETVTGECR
jgi:hypothetical protein